MKILRFLFLFLLPCSFAFGQGKQLHKFQQESKGPDGQIYLFEGMADENGTVVIPANYDYIWQFGPDTVTIARKRLWNAFDGFMEFQYQLITKGGFLSYEFPSHLIPEPIKEGLVRTFHSKSKKFGYVNGFGERIIKYTFPEARDFSEGRAAVKDPKSGLFGYIDVRGKSIIPASYTEAFSFSEGQAVVKKGKRFFFCTASGMEIPLNPTYTHVFDLNEGFSVVENDSAYGFIDKYGKEIVAPRFDFLDNFELGTAVFVLHNDAGMINTSGEIVIEPQYDELYRFDQQHYLFQRNGLNGLIKTNGALVIPAQYSAINYFSEGLAPVLRSGKWGFADVNGNEVIPCQFIEYKNGFKDGIVEVRLSDKWFLVTGNDTLKLPDYDEVLPFYGYTSAFRREKLWGFLNQQGEEAIEPKFDELVFNEGSVVFGRIPMKDGSTRYSFINNKGRELIDGKYLEVTRFSEGMAAVKTSKGWGFIDENGIEVIPPQYTTVRNFSSGRAAVLKDNHWGFVSLSGKEIIPVFTKIPSFETDEPVAKSPFDSLARIRETFPLYKMQVVGDFDGTCACVEDEMSEYSNMPLLCSSISGKTSHTGTCIPLNKKGDVFDASREENPALIILQTPSSWLKIDKNGNVIP